MPVISALNRFPDAPPQIRALPVEARGYPVPWFVTWIKGEPEFRAVDPAKIEETDRRGLCWICGNRLRTSVKAFVIGPMCCVNKVSAEPPSHLACARFAVTACPFLSKPLAKRRANDLPTHQPPAGIMIERNPGVSAIWVTQSYRSETQPEGGLLFRIGPATRVEWWAQGRLATREEVVESVETGLPALVQMAALDGPEAEALLARGVAKLLRLLPES